MHIACKSGHPEVVKLLFEHKADIEAVDDNDKTAFHFACENGNIEVIKLLLEEGANINVLSEEFGTGLHSLLYMISHNGDQNSNYKEVVELLLEKGSNLKAVNDKGYTPLHILLSGFMYKFVDKAPELLRVLELLLEKGANIEAINNAGDTPLHLACKNGGKEVVGLLIQNGANIEAVNKAGKTPLQLYPHYFNKNFLLPIFSKAIKNLDTKVLVNLCKYAHYRAELTRIDPHDTPIVQNIVNLFKASLVIYIDPSITDQVTQLGATYTFPKKFSLSIFKKAIDEENIKVLVNLCKHAHYRAALAEIDNNDTPQDRSAVEEFRIFLSEYNSIPETKTDKVVGLSDILAQKLQVIATTETNNSNPTDKIIKFLTGSKEGISQKALDISRISDLIMSYVGWQKQWSPITQLEAELQAGQTYKSIDDITMLVKSRGIDISVIANKNLDNLQQAFQFPEETKQIILTNFTNALAVHFDDHPNFKKLFVQDVNKASQFMWLKLIAKTLSVNIVYYSEADSIIHFSGGRDAVASYKIYETSDGQQLIAKQKSMPKVIEVTSSKRPHDNDDVSENEHKAQKLTHKIAEESQDAIEGYSIDVSLGDYKYPLVQDDFLSSRFPSLLKPLEVIIPKVTIEWVSQPSRSNVLQIKSAQEPKQEENSKLNSYSYSNILTGLKIIDTSADALKVAYEPTFEHFNVLLRDAVHLGIMLTGANGYALSLSTTGILAQVYYGEYKQAFIQAATTAGYTLLPTMLGTSLAPILVAYTGYKVANNIYSIYSNYNTPEAQLKSNLAYATLESNLGLQDMAKESLINAMQIVREDFELYHNHELSIQHIAAEYNLMGKLCELKVDGDLC